MKAANRKPNGVRPRRVSTRSTAAAHPCPWKLVAVIGLGLVAAGPAAAIDYTRDVRPILASKCFFCHGPDDATREVGLRLDLEGPAKEDLGGYAAIVPGDPDQSEALVRIEEADADFRMPPADSGKSLSPAEIDTLRAWIAEGAEYEPHWAFEPIERPEPPVIHGAGHPIDRFVREPLADEGLDPAPRADAYTLVRRVYLDLIGLPPTPEEADAFAAYPSDSAYERLVDRLLDSPHYGERWARRWLDLARYSDTNGYEKDRPRTMWPYRDWVIDAINADLPFDRFTVEQLAGDLLPEPTLEQLVATGFHRNTMTNEEGGIDPQEFRFLAVVDRVATTGTTWLGLTLGCAQCHTHKYDPITHTDYYRVFALLNNADETQVALPDEEHDAERRRIASETEAAAAELRRRYAELVAAGGDAKPLAEAADEWAERLRADLAEWTVAPPARVETNLPTARTLDDGSVRVSGDVTNADRYTVTLDPTARTVSALRLEAIPDASLPGGGSGRREIIDELDNGLGDFLLTEVVVEVVGPGGPRPVELAEASSSYTAPGLDAALAIDGRSDTGWTVPGRQRERQTLVVAPASPIHLAPAERLRVTLRHDSFYPSGLGRFRLSTTANAPPSAAVGLTDEEIEAVLAEPRSRSERQRRLVVEAFLERTPLLTAEQAELHRWRNTAAEPVTALAMRERRDEPRTTHRHHRGEYLQRREEVTPGVPAALPGLPEGVEADRLAFARWLVSPDNPLTARVFVNRAWQAFFGVGIVKTVADFGLQGESPSHPMLLDWLAADFIDGGWSRKHLHRRIVTSETYKQAAANPASQAADPENRLLARAQRLRLPAETVRDVTLHASGLLSEEIGGPSVFPPQPRGVTENAYGPLVWVVSRGEDRYRRGLYTFNKRTAPYAAFALFDAPSGEVCVARRDRSTTPLQSLAMLNDEVIVEAARSLALSVIDEASDPSGRAVALLRRCVTRPPEPAEIDAVLRFVDRQRERLLTGEIDPYPILNTGPRFEWRFDQGLAGWRAKNDAHLNHADGVAVVRSRGADPSIGVTFEGPAGPYTVLLEADLDLPGPLELFWTTLDEPAESQERSVTIPVERGGWAEYQTTIAATGPLRSLRIDPGRGEGVARLRSVRLSYGDGLVEPSEIEDPIEAAAWLLAARAVLNLDEVITRP